MKITPEAVKERIAALESAGELSLKEQFYLEYMRESLDKDRRIEQLTAERDALREEGIGTNTKAAADIYFQLVEELDVPPGGSLVQCIDNMRERLAALESRTVKLPDELSGETLLDNYSDVAYSDDTGVLEYTNIIGCFVKITAPPDKVIRFRWSNEGMHIILVDRVKTHEHAGIIVDFPKNYKDFIQ